MTLFCESKMCSIPWTWNPFNVALCICVCFCFNLDKREDIVVFQVLELFNYSNSVHWSGFFFIASDYLKMHWWYLSGCFRVGNWVSSYDLRDLCSLLLTSSCSSFGNGLNFNLFVHKSTRVWSNEPILSDPIEFLCFKLRLYNWIFNFKLFQTRKMAR